MKLAISQDRKQTHKQEEQIIKNICEKFLAAHDVPFIFKFQWNELPGAEITLKKNKMISSSIINISDECRNIINKLANAEGVVLSWNNTGCTFWIKHSCYKLIKGNS